jgi:hypothetical protein
MANIKELIEHVAKKHWEYGQGGVWDRPDNAPDAPFPAYADDTNKNQFRAYATRLLEDAPILADVMRDEALRSLLSYCETKAESEPEDWQIYADIAEKLKGILDGEA